MRVLVLTTTARITPDWVRELEGSLPLDGSPEVSILTLTPPKGRLPVERCLVVGRSFRPGRAVRDVPVRSGQKVSKASPGRRERALRRMDRAVVRILPERWSSDRARMLATGTVWSRTVRDEVARADFVIAHDYNTTWAAWLLARRVPGAHVVFQPEGMHLKLAELAGAHPPGISPDSGA